MLVLTRPDPAAHRFAADARRAGIGGAILFSPILRIVALPGGALPGGTLVFTSEAGVRAAGARGSLAGRRAWAVGGRTARAARAAGARVRVAGGDAAALLRALLAEGRGPYVHCRGRHASGELAGDLAAHGLGAKEVVLYDQVATPLTPAARAALGHEDAVLPLFSARSARLVAAELTIRPAARVAAISPAVAAAWPWPDEVRTAPRPDAAAVLVVVRGLVGGGCGG